MTITKPGFRGGLIRYLALSCIFLSLAQTTAAQSGTVTLPAHNTTAGAIIREIENQSGYMVTVNWGQLDPNRSVALSAITLPVKDMLNQTLSGTGYTWELIHGRIVITKEKPDDVWNVRSAMKRDDFKQSQLRFIPDPWSRTQQPFDNMVDTRVVRMSDGNGLDSTGMAVVNFRVNSSNVERDYMDNARALKMLNRTFQNREILSTLDYMVITAGSSPEGSEARNEKLAAERALALKSYIMWKFPFLDRDIIYTFSIGEDWTGLRWLVENDPYTPNQSEVLYLLDSRQSNDAKKSALKRIAGGRAYAYISQYMLPKLRGGAALSLHYKAAPKPIVIVEEKIVIEERIVRDTVYVDRIIEQPVTYVKKPMFALKTNLLFDAVTALNVELEIPIGQSWSVAGEWIFPFWEFSPKRVLQTKTGIFEVRYWPGNRMDKPKLTGWFVGLHGGGGNFDLCWGDTGYQGRSYWMAGVSGGYAHTVSRNGNWRMEYSLGLGYMRTRYSEYKPTKGLDEEWHLIRQKDGINTWIGPTRAKASLVWMINGNFKQKGGSK